MMEYMDQYGMCPDYNGLEDQAERIIERFKRKYHINDKKDYLLEHMLLEYKTLKISSEMAFLFNTMRYLKMSRKQEINLKIVHMY